MTMRAFGAGLVLAGLLAGAAAASSTGRCGGTGGSRTVTHTCPPGQYIVGFGARTGAYVDSIVLRCAPFDRAGKRGALGPWQTLGASGGTDYRDDVCDGDKAIYALYVRSGGYLDHVGFGACGKRQRAGGFAQKSSDSTIVVSKGGIGGTSCSLTCPTGEALYEITVKSGGWIDSIRGACRE